MDFTPGERAVLGQIRVLYSTAEGRDQHLKALRTQWPPIHCQAYERAYASLLAKDLIQDVGAQSFRITDAGLEAIGVTTVAQPRPQPRPVQEGRPAASVSPCIAVKPRGNLLSRLMSGLLRART
jgi:hypothetical protein